MNNSALDAEKVLIMAAKVLMLKKTVPRDCIAVDHQSILVGWKNIKCSLFLIPPISCGALAVSRNCKNPAAVKKIEPMK